MPRKPRFIHPLRQLRSQLRLTQPQLAERVGISASLVQAIENGERPMSQAVEAKFTNALGIMPGSVNKRGRSPKLVGGMDVTSVANPGEYWRLQARTRVEQIPFRLDHFTLPVELVFRAAVDSERANATAVKGFAFANALLKWLPRAVKEFGLTESLKRVISQMTEAGVIWQPPPGSNSNPYLIGEDAAQPDLRWLQSSRKLDAARCELEKSGIGWQDFEAIKRDVLAVIAQKCRTPKRIELMGKAIMFELLLEFYPGHEALSKEAKAAFTAAQTPLKTKPKSRPSK